MSNIFLLLLQNPLSSDPSLLFSVWLPVWTAPMGSIAFLLQLGWGREKYTKHQRAGREWAQAIFPLGFLPAGKQYVVSVLLPKFTVSIERPLFTERSAKFQ